MGKENLETLHFFCILTGKVFLMIGKNVWKIGVPIAISPLHDKDKDRKWVV